MEFHYLNLQALWFIGASKFYNINFKLVPLTFELQ